MKKMCLSDHLFLDLTSLQSNQIPAMVLKAIQKQIIPELLLFHSLRAVWGNNK